MNESEHIMTRYLLGELSESEQAALEERYFTDPQVFDQVLKTESELVDNYARGRLSPQARERFEQYYMAHPGRRERVKFAEALTTRIDHIEESRVVAEPPVGAASLWQRLLVTLFGQRLTVGFSVALASLLIVIGGAWFFIESRRSRQELAQTPAARTDIERREREPEPQIAPEPQRTEELRAEAERRPRPQPQPPRATPTPRARTTPAFASLLLTVGGVRGSDTGETPTLVIPRGTAEARLQLNLKEHNYAGYRVSLQAAGGPEIFSRQGLKPRTTKSGARFLVIVPARKFATGDYILTLRGVSPEGEIDDLSKSIFRVVKR